MLVRLRLTIVGVPLFLSQYTDYAYPYHLAIVPYMVRKLSIVDLGTPHIGRANLFVAVGDGRGSILASTNQAVSAGAGLVSGPPNQVRRQRRSLSKTRIPASLMSVLP